LFRNCSGVESYLRVTPELLWSYSGVTLSRGLLEVGVAPSQGSLG